MIHLENEKWSIFTDDEKKFLSEIFVKHPKIEQNFKRYLEIMLELRFEVATLDLKKTPRTGWVRREIPNPEDIELHTDYVEIYAFWKAPTNVDAYRCLAMASIHDIPEALMTDFTPHDPISSEDKFRLEILAIKVIYQSSEQKDKILDLIREFAEQKTLESQWVRDVDKLDPLFVALEYEARYPHKMGIFEDFYRNDSPKIKTEQGKKILQDLWENKDAYRDIYRQNKTTEKRGTWAVR